MSKRRAVVLVLLVPILLGLWVFLIGICADGGAMGAAYRTCGCLGLEWQVYDRTSADGPRRTLCVGVRRSRTCYQFREGPRVACLP
jgi:hypothetical protein